MKPHCVFHLSSGGARPSYGCEQKAPLTASVVAAAAQWRSVLPLQTLLNQCGSIMAQHKLIFQARANG